MPHKIRNKAVGSVVEEDPCCVDRSYCVNCNPWHMAQRYVIGTLAELWMPTLDRGDNTFTEDIIATISDGQLPSNNS